MIPVPSYKAFRQVSFQPLGPVGAKCDIDEVSVLWKPDLLFTERPAKLEFTDDFEKDLRDADLNGLHSHPIRHGHEGSSL